MQPKLCYTIWFTQRTGSTLLCQALEETGIAGVPHEWFWQWAKDPPTEAPAELQRRLWKNGSTSNGVFGVKHSFHEPYFSQLVELFRRFPTYPPGETNRVKVWESALPNHKHIFMTRRNKVRLAVSWWKAIQTQEWHRRARETHQPVDLEAGYDFDAIQHLYDECSMREAGIQEFFTEGKIVPLTLVYEDFIQQYDKTVRNILAFLELDTINITIPAPSLVPTADDLSESWVQRFRKECQHSWKNWGW